MVELDTRVGIPPRPDSLLAPRRYRLVAARRWRWTQPHINLKEARVALMGLRRSLRSVKGTNRKTLTITDSLVSAGAFAKGRATGELNGLCRRACAYRLGGQV